MLRKKSDEVIIEPQPSWFSFNLQELWQFRDLFVLFVRREFITKYRQTALGPIWYLLQPLLLTFTFTLVFGKFAKLSTDGVPHILFYLSGLLIWGYFVQCFDTTAYALSNNISLFGKVYFPRLIIPLSAATSKLMPFLIQLVLFTCVYLYYNLFTQDSAHLHPRLALLLIPFFLWQTAAVALGAGLWVASLSVKYKDFGHVTPFVLQLWLYGTPVIYPASRVPEKYSFLFHLNPLTPTVEGLRYAFFGTGTFSFSLLAISFLMSSLLLISGLIFFTRIERTFVDTI
jgi:lipopolysaccharide transport system permease protein